MEKEKQKEKKKEVMGDKKERGQEVLLNGKLQNEVPDCHNSDWF